MNDPGPRTGIPLMDSSATLEHRFPLSKNYSRSLGNIHEQNKDFSSHEAIA